MSEATEQLHQAEPLEVGQWPSWLVVRIREAIEAGKVRRARFRGTGDRELVVDFLRGSILFGRWGCCGDRLALEAEPDAGAAEIQAEANRLGLLLGARVRICCGSPTMRVELIDPSSSCDTEGDTETHGD